MCSRCLMVFVPREYHELGADLIIACGELMGAHDDQIRIAVLEFLTTGCAFYLPPSARRAMLDSGLLYSRRN
jgi:hypothetical protein